MSVEAERSSGDTYEGAFGFDSEEMFEAQQMLGEVDAWCRWEVQDRSAQHAFTTSASVWPALRTSVDRFGICVYVRRRVRQT